MTSITLSREVKEELRQLKPEAMTWDEFLALVARCLDPDRFEAQLEAFFEEAYEEAVARARERLAAARDDPSLLLDPEEAREQVARARDEA